MPQQRGNGLAVSGQWQPAPPRCLMAGRRGEPCVRRTPALMARLLLQIDSSSLKKPTVILIATLLTSGFLKGNLVYKSRQLRLTYHLRFPTDRYGSQGVSQKRPTRQLGIINLAAHSHTTRVRDGLALQACWPHDNRSTKLNSSCSISNRRIWSFWVSADGRSRVAVRQHVLCRNLEQWSVVR
jgi:hypothetical protein